MTDIKLLNAQPLAGLCIKYMQQFQEKYCMFPVNDSNSNLPHILAMELVHVFLISQ